jgi:hypothetical protein
MIFRSFNPIHGLSSLIINVDKLLICISNPAMPTIDLTWPLPLTLLPLRENRHFNHAISSNNIEFFLIIMKVDGAKSNENRYTQPWSNVTCIMLGIPDRSHHKLLHLQWNDFYPLHVVPRVDELDFPFICMMLLIVGKKQVLWLHSEVPTRGGLVQGIDILDGFCQIPLVFREGDLPIHSLDHFLIV